MVFSSFDRRGLRLAAIAAVAALALAGCGRKSGLDAPPSASANRAPAPDPFEDQSEPYLTGMVPPPPPPGQDRPPPPPPPPRPPAQQNSFFLDWLLK